MEDDDLDRIGCGHPRWLDHKCASCQAKARVRTRIKELEGKLEEAEYNRDLWDGLYQNAERDYALVRAANDSFHDTEARLEAAGARVERFAQTTERDRLTEISGFIEDMRALTGEGSGACPLCEGTGESHDVTDCPAAAPSGNQRGDEDEEEPDDRWPMEA